MIAATQKVVYPETDGMPMADNTLQYRWIVTLQGGFDDLYRDNPDVFVAGNLFWYPVEGDNTVVQAPDVMVVVGRPKGDRRSYRQWEEDATPPQVVFEVLSPGNRPREMARKLLFYEDHGVSEYYVYNPDRVRLTVHQRRADDGGFESLDDVTTYTSPLTGVRFDLTGPEMVVWRPDGQRFLTYMEQSERADAERQRADALAADRDRLKALLRAAGLDPDSTTPPAPTGGDR